MCRGTAQVFGEVEGEKEWEVSMTKAAVLLRPVAALFVGFLVAIGLAITVSRWLPTFFLREMVHTLVGGCVAGYIARRHGWVHGALCAVLVEACRLGFSLWAFSWGLGRLGVLKMHLETWPSSVVTLCAGIAGGYVGELFSRIRRHRFAERA